MLTEYLNYTLSNLPDDSLISFNFAKAELPEVVGYCTLEEALGGKYPKITHVNNVYRYALRKELLTDGIFIPLPYESRESGKVVLVHCGYELILEQFYASFAQPLGLTKESLKLFIDRYEAYIGDRATREAEAKLSAKLAELAELTGKSVEDLRKKLK